MKQISKFFFILVVMSFFIVTPVAVVFADVDGNPTLTNKIKNPLGSSDMTIETFLLKVLEGALKIGTPIIALAIIYCGFLFVKAQGNPEEITKAKEALMYTLIGAAILLGAVAISKLIVETVTTIAA